MSIEQTASQENIEGQIQGALEKIELLHTQKGYLLMYDHEAESEGRPRQDISSFLENLTDEAAEKVWDQINDNGWEIKGIDTPPKEKKSRSNSKPGDDLRKLDLFLENESLKALINESGSSQKGLLTQRGEIELAIKRARGLRLGSKQSIEEAEHELSLRNLKLIYSIAKKYQGHGLDTEDLFQEGYLGFLRGVKKFDWKRGFKLSTYTTWWIRQGVVRAIKDYDIHPTSFINLKRKMNDAIDFLRAKLGREKPTDKEIAELMEVSSKKVADIKKYTKEIYSMEDPVGDEDATLGEFIADPSPGPEEISDEIEGEEMAKELVSEILSVLSKRERKVLEIMHFTNPKRSLSLDETGDKTGVTRERIRQIQIKAQGKFKMYLKTHKKVNPVHFQKYLEEYLYGERD